MQDGRQRNVCPSCGWTYYDQLKVGAAALVEQDGKLLLLRRARPPWKGQWYLPAGYVEAGETPQDAAVREVREECGLEVKVANFLDTLFFNDDPRGNGLLLVYRCQITGGELVLTEEITEFQWFSPEEIPVEIAGAGHAEMVNRWKIGQL